MVKTQQAAVGMWSTCKVVQHVHSLHRHALRLGGFLRLFVRSCTGWEWSTCKVVHDPLHRCIPGGLGGALGRRLWSLLHAPGQPGQPGQVADGPTKGRASVRRTPLLAAQPPGLSQFQQVARTPFQRGNRLRRWVPCRLRLHALQQVAGLLQTGFSAAFGSTRINFLPSKPPINFTYRCLFFALLCYFSYVICAK